MKISTMDRDGSFKAWCDDPNGTHVALPLDGEVSDAVVLAMIDEYEAHGGTQRYNMRKAIAALAQALGEVGDE